jgi:NAD(P)-dependent dehydrogenase (short-subunit alcohol dehydrogenase family)
MTLSGRHALVTGAGTGIGAAIVRAIVGAGANVTLAGRRKEPLATLAKELGAATFAADDFDVTDAEKVAAGISRAREKFGSVDILVNNAGEAPSAPFAKTDAALWGRVLAINLTGTYLVTHAVLPDMIARKAGRIVNIASTAGLVGYRGMTAYAAAKHGVIGLTRALALEVAKSGITVNAGCPGYTDTGIIRGAVSRIAQRMGRGEDEALKTFTDSNPQGRLVTPDEVANTVLWLLSDGAAAVNGQAIPIAGGEVMAG